MLTRERVLAAALVPLAGLLLFTLWGSLDWRMVHDPPLFLYQGFLMDRGWIPYRDFWDNNPPGTQLLHWAVVHFVGYGDRSLRYVDLAFIGTTMTATFVALRALDARAAAFAAMSWGLTYLVSGPGFQRDDVVTLALSLCLAVCLAAGRLRDAARAALAGFVLGCAAMVKPPALLGLPILVAYLAGRTTAPAGGRELMRRGTALAAWAAAGVGLVVCSVTAYLWWTGALAPFLDIARDDWPLYTRLSGGLATIQSPLFNLYSGYRRFGRLQSWLPPALVGLSVAAFAFRREPDKQRVLGLLLALGFAFLAYVGIQGKFFVYHWNPFRYLLLLLASLGLVDPGPGAHFLARGLGPVVALWFAISTTAPARLQRGAYLQRLFTAAPKNGRVDEIAAFLRANARPGDTVQPLDWTGGVLHAMLIANALPATPYLYDYVFYHHVSNNSVADLRGRFLDKLRSARPRYVIEVENEDKPWVRGKDTTRDFNKLRRFLEERYDVVARRNGYAIYERRP